MILLLHPYYKGFDDFHKSRKELGADGGWNYMAKLKKMGFPPGYQVLCATCNKIKQIEVDPKGT